MTSAAAPSKRVVDRTVHALLPSHSENGDASSTPSAADGISPAEERLHRLHGTSLLHDASTILRLPPSAYATACVLFHRLYHRISLNKHCVWSSAMACTFLACKVEEEPRSVHAIIITFAHLYRRRRLRADDDVAKYSYGAADCEAETAATLTNEEKENVLRSAQPMPMGGPAYAEWKNALFERENVVLRALGFTVHWIPDGHPHKFILYFVRVLGIESKEVAQEAWNYCNDSCRLDLCVRYEPEVIACAAILMAASNHDAELPLVPRPWWEVFIGADRNHDLSTVCNSILAVRDELELDNRRAKYAFVPSLMKEPSFNDPDSYLWSVSD